VNGHPGSPAAPSPLLADMPLGVPSQLVRYRLIERLSARWDQSVLTLCGGPGFGKTTALAQAVRQHALDPRGVDVWYTCGPADRR
jgi:ATP/maltotriose-dependent transcriptional regulator MalT